MEYFIVERGEMWDSLLEILERKVQEGVEVRFMYDGMCCLVLLPYSYPKELRAKGLKAKMFAPIRPALSTYQNNRDHRKILVIDGHTAFTGGINLADEVYQQEGAFRPLEGYRHHGEGRRGHQLYDDVSPDVEYYGEGAGLRPGI